MSNEPFRSRPRIRRPVEPSIRDIPEEDVIEGVIAEEYPPVMPPPLETPRQPPPITVDIAPPVERRRRSRKTRQPERVRFYPLEITDLGLFFITLALIGGGVFFTLMNVTTLPDSTQRWYPAPILAGALLWSFVALSRRDATKFLGGAAVAGFSLSLLFHTQDIAPFAETFAGITLITIGVAVVVRGLLLRQSTTT